MNIEMKWDPGSTLEESEKLAAAIFEYNPPGYPGRWTIDTAAGTASADLLDDHETIVRKLIHGWLESDLEEDPKYQKDLIYEIDGDDYLWTYPEPGWFGLGTPALTLRIVGLAKNMPKPPPTKGRITFTADYVDPEGRSIDDLYSSLLGTIENDLKSDLVGEGLQVHYVTLDIVDDA